MTTKQTVEDYFEALSKGRAWQAFLSDDMTFVSHTSPTKEAKGKDAFVESTRGFYATIAQLEVKQLVVDGERACAQARYRLEPKEGAPFTCEVAEMFVVRDGKIASFEIYFDSAPFSPRAQP